MQPFFEITGDGSDESPISMSDPGVMSSSSSSNPSSLTNSDEESDSSTTDMAYSVKEEDVYEDEDLQPSIIDYVQRQVGGVGNSFGQTVMLHISLNIEYR